MINTSNPKIEQVRKILRFIGKDSIKLLIYGVFTGISLFGVEVFFAYMLQVFLVVMKIVPSGDTLNFPKWLPSDRPYVFLLLVVSVLLARGVIRWLHSYLSSAAADIQANHQRARLIEWAFSARTVNIAKFMTLYQNGAQEVTSILVNLQNAVIMISAATFIFIYLLKISVFVSFLSILILATIALVMKGLDQKIENLGNWSTGAYALVNQYLFNNIKNLVLMQIYGTERREKDRVIGDLKRAVGYLLKYRVMLNLRSALPQAMGVILICVLCVEATQRSWIPSGLMITYFYLFLQFVNNVSETLRLYSSIRFSRVPAEQFAKWWADHSHDGVRNRFDPNKIVDKRPFERSRGIRFQKVGFSYSPQDPQILKDFDLDIQPNSCVVLVGESGSGKSTILNLALGLYQQTAGKIEVYSSDSKDELENIKGRLLASVGYVGPESFLIDGTVRENLMYGLEASVSETDILYALDRAGCKFVLEMKNGLEHRITEQGQGLSAGQKQRIAFARALLRKPKLLVLDEATSNLDSETEAKMVEMLAKLKSDMTIISVTHREAMLSIADQVIRLKPMKLGE